MRLGQRLVPLFAVVVTVALAGCKPDYPKCESDDHCKDKGEVCLNGQCQECREDAQCVTKRGEGFECQSGRCEQKPECRADGDCASVGEGLVCRSNKCVPECASNEDCPSGRKCEAQKCVAECAQDIDCGPGRTCADGACQDADRGSSNVSAACRPMSGSAGEVVSLQTVLFDFNEYDLTVDARSSLDQAAQCLKEAPQVQVVLEGHGDERGTQEYNLALGEKRANAVKKYLNNLGVNTSRLKTRSKGENEPVCSEQTDSCFSRNRRVQFQQSIK